MKLVKVVILVNFGQILGKQKYIYIYNLKLGFQNDTKRMKIGSLYNFPKLYNNSYKFACIQKNE